jgi:hypothetical protein
VLFGEKVAKSKGYLQVVVHDIDLPVSGFERREPTVEAFVEGSVQTYTPFVVP